ncbi:cytochrome d ubiquinol oxidase subunit II, partial [Salmonella enterica subsp. enterica]
NPLQDKMRNLAKKLLIALLLTITIISLWTPLTHHAIAERWFTLPNLWFLLPVPLFVALFSLGAWRSLNQQHYHALPFVLTLGLIFLGFSGLGISIWPHIIPPSITLWQAAAPTQSQGFMLVGALLIIPIILVYTFWSYYVFRGKVQHGEGYH